MIPTPHPHALLVPRGDADFDLYPYTPSATLGYVFLVLFALAGVVHLVMLGTLRSWFFIPLVLGCAGEAAGYWARTQSHANIRNGGPYLLQLMLILASAPLISATIYMTLGRVILRLDARHLALCSPRWTTKIYVLIDVVSFVCQMAGSAMQGSGDPEGVKTGKTVVVAGLGVQMGAFAGFVLMAVVVHGRLNREPTATAMRTHVPWRRHFWALYSVSALVVVRSAFRLAEFVEGPEGPLYRTETYLYVFDAAVMVGVVLVLAIVHPGMLLRAIRKAEMVKVAGDDNGEFLLRGGAER